jgi:hypothetical protein
MDEYYNVDPFQILYLDNEYHQDESLETMDEMRNKSIDSIHIIGVSAANGALGISSTFLYVSSA